MGKEADFTDLSSENLLDGGAHDEDLQDCNPEKSALCEQRCVEVSVVNNHDSFNVGIEFHYINNRELGMRKDDVAILRAGNTQSFFGF